MPQCRARVCCAASSTVYRLVRTFQGDFSADFRRGVKPVPMPMPKPGTLEVHDLAANIIAQVTPNVLADLALGVTVDHNFNLEHDFNFNFDHDFDHDFDFDFDFDFIFNHDLDLDLDDIFDFDFDFTFDFDKIDRPAPSPRRPGDTQN